MKKIVSGSCLIILIGIVFGIIMYYFKTESQSFPKKLIPKYSFGKRGKSLGEFKGISDLSTKDNYLFIAVSGNNRIQVFQINPDGSLSPKFTFGKEGKELGEFGNYLTEGCA